MRAPGYWRDSDATHQSNGGLVFNAQDDRNERWFLPFHGIFTSTCQWWAHYIPQRDGFVIYRVDHMVEALNRRRFQIVYTPHPPRLPTNRGHLYPLASDEVPLTKVRAHESFCGAPLLTMARGKAGKMAELHFVGTCFAQPGGGNISFAEAWQDTKGNDVQLPSGDWVQVKLDRGAHSSGNLYVQTHTRTKGTDWLEA